jgi:pimeloyl-ACP methyl ester carboxylesterase
VDLLLARGDVDPARIAYVGHSYGATQGGVLAGVEPRIRTFVLMGGLPSLIDTTLGGAPKYDAYQVLLARAVPPEQWSAYCDSIGPLTPALYVGRAAPASVFMQFGTADSWISPAAADAYFAAAAQPKTMRRYPCSHEFNDPRALADRAEWLHEEIGIRAVTPLLEGVLKARPGDR